MLGKCSVTRLHFCEGIPRWIPWLQRNVFHETVHRQSVVPVVVWRPVAGTICPGQFATAGPDEQGSQYKCIETSDQELAEKTTSGTDDPRKRFSSGQ